MTRALVLQHMNDDDLCLFEELLLADGISIDTVHLYDGEEIPGLAGYDLMMVLGGPMDVWQTDEHPWLVPEQEAIREWVAERARPYIGVCLGHQLLATALGGEVTKAAQSEVGLHWMTVAPDVEHRFLAGLPDTLPVMQWHHAEVSRAPDGAKVLASSPAAQVQALAVGEHALGVQFHFEWTMERVRNWPDDWLAALHRELGDDAHDAVIAAAEPHMAGINDMARTIYGNFKQATGL